MTHDELLASIIDYGNIGHIPHWKFAQKHPLSP
jgi:hypothetical protein